MSLKTYKCPMCGWVHSAIPLDAAQEQVNCVNEWYASKGEPATENIAHYMSCFQCGASAADFVRAKPGDAPIGSTIQAAVVPGAFDG
jgi:rubredoxin